MRNLVIILILLIPIAIQAGEKIDSFEGLEITKESGVLIIDSTSKKHMEKAHSQQAKKRAMEAQQKAQKEAQHPRIEDKLEAQLRKIEAQQKIRMQELEIYRANQYLSYKATKDAQYQKQRQEQQKILDDIHASDSLLEKIKLKTSPESYWEAKVKNLEWSVSSASAEIRDLVIEYKKILATKDLELAQAVNDARYIGADPRQARIEMWEGIQHEIITLKAVISENRVILNRDQTWLEQARRMLSVYRQQN
ncbi:MAG: hypothetical protein HUN04_02750 [Desulfobacter sp.]|nr:MAG: hypothetical protein HUN04_02750 [Desulfobacter sp.]|eukprot:Anaeramoba_ignava/a479488_7.p1 GENE.a479488_7~~a479488_7.p1  ORF type:complete len:251 (+),score=31.33 a479488_7:89-841(+)